VSVSPDVTSHRKLLICLAIVCVAFGVRLLQWQNNFLTLDKEMTRLTARYKEEAQFLLAGDLTSFVKGSKSEADEMILTHPPGYPILMAIIYKISGNSDAALRLFQIACEALAAVLVFLIAARLIPRGAALLAAFLVAIAPQLAFRSLVILPDSLTALPLLAAILLIIKAVEDQSVRNMILAGALIGISCWLRADAILLPVFLSAPLLLLLPRGQWRRHALALIGGAVIVIAPMTIRNALVFRSFIPVSLGTGVILCEGIGDYDVEQRFGLSTTDDGTCAQEAQWAGRPEYAGALYRPDGIVRERSRTARAWAVIRSNPAWFIGVMVRRTLTMLTYEQVPIISAQPTVLHPLEIAKDKPLVWSRSPQELLSESQTAGSVSLRDESTLLIESDSFQLVTKPIAVRPNFDYLLTVPVKIHQGKASITVRRLARPQILASASLPDSLERVPFTNEFAPAVQIPFVSPNEGQVQLTIASVKSSNTSLSLDIGGAQLNELGPSAYLWTKYPRMLVKSVQKLFVTPYILALTILGLVLLAFYRRKLALAVILPVPLYYLFSHAPIHFEHRYILPAHFFWFMLAGLALYWIGLVCMRLVIWSTRAFRRAPSEAVTQATE
ncbi:MAG TPA: glycosyltransferase family 39 protein, partial [Pyrinomonadaceae bacterium]|nr:glycosyltransferase family 39 protein [Pyrinomonadaceae bacterium]